MLWKGSLVPGGGDTCDVGWLHMHVGVPGLLDVLSRSHPCRP